MKATSSILILLISGVMQSCWDGGKDNIEQLAVVNKSLEYSIRQIDWDIQKLYSDLKGRMSRPEINGFAARDFPKVVYMKRLTDKIVPEIREIKNSFIKAAKFYPHDETSPVAANTKTARKFFHTEGYSEILYSKLLQYREDILQLDPRLKEQFAGRHFFTIPPGKTAKDFTASFFSQSNLSALTMLQQVEYNCLVAEYIILSYYWENITDHLYPYPYSRGPFSGQTSDTVLPGQSIEISAGTSDEYDKILSILIDGIKIPFEADGTAVYQFNASAETGNYEKMLVIIFEKRGSVMEYKQKISYRVIDSSGQNQRFSIKLHYSNSLFLHLLYEINLTAPAIHCHHLCKRYKNRQPFQTCK
jgi:hypothetical protein